MKKYEVYYYIKANRTETLHRMYVEAKNAREACTTCKAEVKRLIGKNAFTPTIQVPDEKILERYAMVGLIKSVMVTHHSDTDTYEVERYFSKLSTYTLRDVPERVLDFVQHPNRTVIKSGLVTLYK